MAQPLLPPSKLQLELKLPFDFLKRANLRGVVGNITSLGIVGLIALIAIALVSIWVPAATAGLLVVAVLALIAFVTISIRRTLKEDPAAVLEDQDYLEYRKMQMEAAKDRPAIPLAVAPSADPNPPLLIEAAVTEDTPTDDEEGDT